MPNVWKAAPGDIGEHPYLGGEPPLFPGIRVAAMRFDQVKFVANDVERLIAFYVEALDCSVARGPVEVNDPEIIGAIGAPPGSRITLAMLSLPGPEEGVVLELYSIAGDDALVWPYSPGQGQIAFQVDDVDAVVVRAISSGGSRLGEVADWQTPWGSTARFVYLRDPEGNIVDVWSRAT